MRDTHSGPLFGRVLLGLCVLALIVWLSGCVTIYDCGAGIKSRLLLAECEWDLSRGR